MTSASRRERRHGSSSSATTQKIEGILRDARVAQGADRESRALELYEVALTLDPKNVEALCAYSALATRSGDPERGVEAGRRAAMLRPSRAAAHHCLGAAMRNLGQVQGAIASLGRAIELESDRLESLLELCLCFLDAGDIQGAEPFLNRALDADANSAVAQMALGRFYKATGRLDDAIAAFRRARILDSRQLESCLLLGSMLRDAGDLEGAITVLDHAVAIAPNRPDAWSSLLLTLQCSDGFSAKEVADRHREFGAHFKTLLSPLPLSPFNPLPGRKLKVGYLSSNFRRHAVAKFVEPLIEEHDRNRFEIYCYYNHSLYDSVTRRVGERADRFSTVFGKRDGHVAAQIRRDGIDILVDLDGHTMPNRLPVFFLRPAPIQVSWLGYLATTGIAAVNYRLTDSRADPDGAADELHTETLWRLPTTAWCYRPYDEAPELAPPPFASNGFMTFVSLNDPGKMTWFVMELWARILGQVEKSRLILHVSPQASRISGIEAFFSSRGVNASRLTLLQRQPLDQYLALYSHADIALDTWPCAGGTTTCDAMWMGVPVVTLSGAGSFSRTGISLLNSVGLGEFAADTPDSYVAKAVGLAQNRPGLAALRANLRRHMRASALTNSAQFARDIEAAFLGMWARYGEDRGQKSA